MAYETKQKEYGLKLIKEGFFDGDLGGGFFKYRGEMIMCLHILQNRLNNLYPSIREEVLNYFKENKITWWGGKKPTGNILSSQTACLNHLFPIRNDKSAVLNLLKSISDNFIDVFPIDEKLKGYIQFEAVGGDENLLNEGTNTRGSQCTSIDALIYAKHRDGRKFLIPIEWKYVERYYNEDKSIGSKGDERKSRYVHLIRESQYLIYDNTLSCCWLEPFYQLMRQTLWAEQMLIHKPTGFEADDYMHIHVIPDGNKELLNKSYPCSNKNMEATWKNCLKDTSKYLVISPEKLFAMQNKETDLYKYLQKRYWQ
jgi:hypothetical protein